MKIKLSKSQWEMVGSKAGWMNKKAQMDNEEVMHIQGLVQRLKDLKKELDLKYTKTIIKTVIYFLF